MLEKMRSDADHYSKFPPSNNQQRQELKTIWDRRVEQLTHSVQDTGILISKVKGQSITSGTRKSVHLQCIPSQLPRNAILF